MKSSRSIRGLSILLPFCAAAVPGQTPETSPPRWEVLAGATDWRWEESITGRTVLVESGLVPTLMARYVRESGPWRTGTEAEVVYGAIAYEGSLQDVNNGAQKPYSSNTHYFAGDAAAWAGRILTTGSGARLVPCIGLGYHRWIRTLDSDRFNQPGIHGYIETWQHATVEPRLRLELPMSGTDMAGLEAGLRIPFWTSEHVGGLGGTGGGLDLEPDTRNAVRVLAQARLGRLLVEAQWLSLPFARSPNVTEKLYFQPASSLRRIDLRLGLWF